MAATAVDTPRGGADQISPWQGPPSDSRQPSTMILHPDDILDRLDAAAAPRMRHSPNVPAVGAVTGDREDDDDAGSEEVDVAADEGVDRKTLRRLLKGTTIYFQAASPRDVVLVNAVESGCRVTHNEEKADITWIEAIPRTPESVRSMVHQRINFFPGMRAAAHKCEFSRLVTRVAMMYPDDFPFIPRTFALPADQSALKDHVEKNPGGIYVVKPDGGCGGEGIYLTDAPTSVKHAECVVQDYVANPLTIGGLKFDFRLYVAVTSIYPLRYYLHREGLGRMAVEPYEAPCKANFHKLNMHLTNYSLNKFNNKFVENVTATDDAGSTKRRASTAMRQLADEYEGFDRDEVWASIEELVGKTLACIAPHILATVGEQPGVTNYLSRCFQLLGFDVLLDTDFKPHLLEVNAHPSLQTDAPIDYLVKSQVVKPLVCMVSLDAKLNRKAARAKSEFSPPSSAEAAEWEARFVVDDPEAVTGFISCDPARCAALTSRYMAPFLPLLYCFTEACGGSRSRHYDLLGSSRFTRFLRRVEVCGGVGRPFSVPEIDLLCIKCLQKRGGGNTLDFQDFVDAMTGPVGDRLSPYTAPSSLARLRDVSSQLTAPLP